MIDILSDVWNYVKSLTWWQFSLECVRSPFIKVTSFTQNWKIMWEFTSNKVVCFHNLHIFTSDWISRHSDVLIKQTKNIFLQKSNAKTSSNFVCFLFPLDDARLRMPNNTPAGAGLSSDIECLPNYTLVSGLPTYDDALEQIRLRSTNHLLINHQTIMKMFGSIKDKPKKQKPDIPVPTYEDSIRSQPTDGSADLSFSNQSQRSLLSNSSHHRFKCSIVVDPPEQSDDQMNGASPSNHSPVFISNSLGSLNISKEIEKSRPEIRWSPHSHRSSSLCVGLENFAFHGHQRHLEHRGSLG